MVYLTGFVSICVAFEFFRIRPYPNYESIPTQMGGDAFMVDLIGFEPTTPTMRM